MNLLLGVLLTSSLSLVCIINLVAGGIAEEDKTHVGGEIIDRMVQLRTHSLYAPYIDQDLQNRWWDFGADAYVNTNKYVRLTQNKPSQMGWLWSRLSVSAINYVIEVEFKITGHSSHLYGDGLALWLTKDRTQEGPIFGNKNQFSGLGIFLDTYSNGQHDYNFPRISAFLGDGKMSYDFGNDGQDQSIGGCSAQYRRTNVATKLRVTYLKDKLLDVKVQYKAWDGWTDCFQINNITLPLLPYLGLTAMTGDVSDSHDIITVTTLSATLAKNTHVEMTQRKMDFFGRKHQTTSGGTKLHVLWKFLLLSALCIGGYFCYREYWRKKKSERTDWDTTPTNNGGFRGGGNKWMY